MSARIDAQANSTDPYISRKTVTTSESSKKRRVSQSGKKNVLNKYRSSTYNFTLAALRKDIVNDPSLYRDKALDLVVLKSGGKGTTGLSTNVSGVDRVVGQEEVTIREGGRVLSKTFKGIIEKDLSGSTLVKSFNQNSSGRFDMFIDDVEIETLMAFTPEGGSTLPTSFKFKVIEPYSINGFIEALHVSAVAAGYASYVEASFVLKMEFIGYPDDANIPDPRIVEDSTRYFPIRLTGIEVEVGDKGTSYRCAAIAWNDSAFGQPNVLKRPITMAGTSVEEILKNFAKELNKQIKDDDQKAKAGPNVKDSDEYEIVFPIRTDSGFDYNQTNIIGKSKLESILKNNANFKFPDPGIETTKQTPQQKDAAPEEVKLHPTPGTGTPPLVQFAEGQQINEIISAVIRDSEYVKNLLKDVLDNKPNTIDKSGFITYFAIKSDVINKSEIDPVSRKPYQKFRYSIIPYRVHFTKVPTLAGQKFDAVELDRSSLREYNYIYTGDNVDILNFKLNFNTLFFEAIPAAMGNNDQPGSRDSAGQPNDTKVQVVGDNVKNLQTDQNGAPKVAQIAPPVIMDGTNAGQRSNDPYYALARNMHNAIINSNSSMLTGDIEILGDPFYLVTGGIGNYDSKPSGTIGLTSDGEADYLQGEVLITINFKNPIDINPLEKGGLFYFETSKLPFSGVYMVTKVVSTFNEGIFKQRLNIIRYPGQIVGNTKETIVAEKVQEQPKPGAQTVETTSQGVNQGGIPASESNLLTLLSRGLPSPGLPGFLSNFIGSQGGLGGNSLLSQVSGAVSRGINGLAGSNSVFGSNIPGGLDQLASGIRLRTAGLISSTQSGLSNAASVLQASDTLKSKFALSGSVESLATDITKSATNLLDKLSIPGSGIGVGASVLVNKVASLDETSTILPGVTSVNILQTSNIPGTSLSLDQVKGLSSNALSAVSTLGADASKLVSSVGVKLTSLTAGQPTDPQGLASKFGISPSQISGLGGDLQSKVLDQLGSLSKKIPEDTNLSVATSRGLALNYIPDTKLGNIPATAPYLTAPKPEVDQQFLSSITKEGGPTALANAFGVTDIKNISGDLLPSQSVSSLLAQATNGIKNPLTGISGNANLPDISALGGKISSAKNLLSSVSPPIGSIESNISSIANKVGDASSTVRNLSNSVSGKFGSVSIGQSPLDKLFNG